MGWRVAHGFIHVDHDHEYHEYRTEISQRERYGFYIHCFYHRHHYSLYVIGKGYLFRQLAFHTRKDEARQ